MRSVKVEGYDVLIERCEGDGFTLTVPSLPGVIGQVEKEEDAVGEIRRLIGTHLIELMKRRKKDEERPAGTKAPKLKR